jgi:hypothetical protein
MDCIIAGLINRLRVKWRQIKLMLKCEVVFSVSGNEPVAGSGEHGGECSRFVKGENLLPG